MKMDSILAWSHVLPCTSGKWEEHPIRCMSLLESTGSDLGSKRKEIDVHSELLLNDVEWFIGEQKEETQAFDSPKKVGYYIMFR